MRDRITGLTSPGFDPRKTTQTGALWASILGAFVTLLVYLGSGHIALTPFEKYPTDAVEDSNIAQVQLPEEKKEVQIAVEVEQEKIEKLEMATAEISTQKNPIQEKKVEEKSATQNADVVAKANKAIVKVAQNQPPPKSPAQKSPTQKSSAQQSSSSSANQQEAVNAIGLVRFFSSPNLTIFVDGRKVGETPIRDVKLKTGQHSVRAYSSSLNIEENFSINIEENKTMKVKLIFLNEGSSYVLRKKDIQQLK
jgi:cytoskeletal protein RodZ